MLLSEIELLNWLDVMISLFTQIEDPSALKQSQVRVLFYQGARIVKRLYNSPLFEAIDTYLSNFQFTNFKE